MKCWFFLLILTFRTVTYKLPQPRPLGFPPPVGRSPPGVSNIALPLSNFPGNPGTQQNFPIVQASLFCHFFQVVNFIWQQTRGAGISSHISSSLSNLAFTIVDRSWAQVFKEVLDLPTFPFSAIRYVDNRYIFFPEEKVQEPSIQVVFEDIYQLPVELEEVTTNELLVFLVDFHIRTMTYKLPRPRPPVFPPPVGRSPPGVSNTALPSFRFFYRPQALNSFFPHCTGIFLLFFFATFVQ